MKVVNCPVCHTNMKIIRLHCQPCDITIEGKFDQDRFTQLSRAIADFLEVFVLARGNIKEIEKQLNISYPTVRTKIDNMVDEVKTIKDVMTELVKKEEKIKAESKKRGQTVKEITKNY